MASFVGSIDEFIRYINPRVKNVVNLLARAYKKEVGACEHCGCNDQILEAAHVTGRERPKIIEEVLSDFINGDVVTVDLEVFENRLRQAHEPISDSILVLCRKCHQIYDSDTKPPKTSTFDFSDFDSESTITNSDVTSFFRSYAPSLEESQIEDLQNVEYCNAHFGVHFPVLRKVPESADILTIRRYAQVNGYSRWSTRNPIVTQYGTFLVLTQWYENSRSRFLVWRLNQRA